MTVVTPLAAMSSTRISGARVAGPPSPPPPRMWTWGSTRPGKDGHPRGVDGLGLEPDRADPARLGHGLDRPSGEEDVPLSQGLRPEDLCAADQGEHADLRGRTLACFRTPGQTGGPPMIFPDDFVK